MNSELSKSKLQINVITVCTPLHLTTRSKYTLYTNHFKVENFNFKSEYFIQNKTNIV